MILFPGKFDINEWFIIIMILVNVIIMLRLPQRLPSTIMLLIMMIGLASAKTLDHIFGTPPLDFFDVNDSPKYELFDLLIYFLYSPFAYYLVYFYDKWHLKGFAAWLYVLAWSVFAIGLDWTCVQLHVYLYKKWTLLYSLPVYLITIGMTLGFFHLLKFLYHRNASLYK